MVETTTAVASIGRPDGDIFRQGLAEDCEAGRCRRDERNGLNFYENGIQTGRQ
jgi:hypothetical protein